MPLNKLVHTRILDRELVNVCLGAVAHTKIAQIKIIGRLVDLTHYPDPPYETMISPHLRPIVDDSVVVPWPKKVKSRKRKFGR